MLTLTLAEERGLAPWHCGAVTWADADVSCRMTPL